MDARVSTVQANDLMVGTSKMAEEIDMTAYFFEMVSAGKADL